MEICNTEPALEEAMQALLKEEGTDSEIGRAGLYLVQTHVLFDEWKRTAQILFFMAQGWNSPPIVPTTRRSLLVQGNYNRTPPSKGMMGGGGGQ